MKQSSPDPPEMGDVQPPAWFSAFQQEMGRLLRTPLDMSSGRFRAAVEAYPRALVDDVRNDGPGAITRLELYHEQYWRRLFNTFQEAFPRTARAVGYFWFNALVSHFLVKHPPRSFDLSEVTEGFFSWLVAALDEMVLPGKTNPPASGYRVIETPLREFPPSGTRSAAVHVLGSVAAPWSLVTQALHVDEAERRAFRAAWETPWQPTALERARLREMRLRYAPSFSLLRLDYDVPVGRPLDDKEFSPHKQKTPAHVVILRAPRGMTTYPVDPIFARLLALARGCPLGEALNRTEKALTGALREHWEQSVNGYIDNALSYGFWIGTAT